MDKQIYEFLKELKFDDAEIQTLLSIAPVLEETSIEQALQNMTIVVQAGFPADDIGYLVSQNPNFLCRNTPDLANDIIKISQTVKDFEEALRNNPHLI